MTLTCLQMVSGQVVVSGEPLERTIGPAETWWSTGHSLASVSAISLRIVLKSSFKPISTGHLFGNQIRKDEGLACPLLSLRGQRDMNQNLIVVKMSKFSCSYATLHDEIRNYGIILIQLHTSWIMLDHKVSIGNSGNVFIVITPSVCRNICQNVIQ